MSKILAGLLDKPQDVVEQALAKLEAHTGYPSEDARLIAATHQTAKQRIAKLGLDPHDTTPEELYHTLLSRFSSDADHLDKALGIDPSEPFTTRADKAVDLVNHEATNLSCWAIKMPVVKSLLKQLPPKKIMKALSYRSIDSMLKRENVSALLTAAKITESPTWQKTLQSKVAHLQTTDYEMRSLQIVDLSSSVNLRCSSVAVGSREAGVIALFPVKNADNFRTLALVLSLTHEVSTIASGGKKINLKNLNPSLSWWEGSQNALAWNDGQPVSLNIMDVAVNHTQQHDFAVRSIQHSGESLWHQLVENYKQHVEELPEALTSLEQEAFASVKQAMAPAPELAEELVEI